MKQTMRVLLFIVAIILGQLSVEVKAQGFTVGSYNLRYANRGDSARGNGWGQRYPVMVNMIQFHGFDIFGTQEGLYPQLEDLVQHLPGYAYTGIGRDDGKHAGEHSAIFYNTDKFELLEKGDFWLSTITDRPNKGWDAVLPRICSWGKFKERKSRFTFYFFNLHMDHVGVKARSESARLILQKIKEFPSNTPVILTGDFNVDQTNEGYAVINNSGILKDAYELSPIKHAANGTFNNFSTDGKSDSRIDHIFVSPQFAVKRYGILLDTYREKRTDSTGKPILLPSGREAYSARVPSDHFPVLIEVTHKK